MKEDLTLIILILDRSGSMSSIKDDVVGGFNQFVKEQQGAAGDAIMHMAQFDSQNPYEVTYDMVEIQKVTKLKSSEYVPRACTPLLDAIGRGIGDIKSKLKAIKKKDRPAKVIFAVMTDGQENSSKEFTLAQVKNMIEKRQGKGWQFAFLGANLDSFAESAALGMVRGTSMNYAPTGAGATKAFGVLGSAALNHRSESLDVTQAEDYEFIDKDSE